MIFGDVNRAKLPHPDAPADPRPDQVPAANVGYRWRTKADGTLDVDREIAEKIARTRWTDAAHHVAAQTTDPDKKARLLAPTGDVGGFAVDWVLLSESMVPALVDMETAAIPSDHDALWWQLDPASIDPARVVRFHA